ncbi:MAG: hypothetical protein Fur0032_09600 [Terrimicrobiaceae bacterium]
MNLLILAGGAFLGLATPQPQPEQELFNHTLRGERVLASEVVCRNRWGTPMHPDGKGAYSLIAPINQEFIALSLIQPPKTPMIPFRPVASVSP